MTRRERKWRRAAAIHASKPSYYVGQVRRPCDAIDPLGALAWDQTVIWMTAREWLDRLRRTGRPYKVYGALTGRKWVPMPRPCIQAHWSPSSTLRRGRIPDPALGVHASDLVGDF